MYHTKMLYWGLMEEKLVYMVYRENNNSSGDIVSYNIFSHIGFYNDLVEIKKKYSDDFDSFSTHVKDSLLYCFWSKCEYEIVISNFPPSKSCNDIKVDIYDQVMLNWGLFINYLWENRKLIKKKK